MGYGKTTPILWSALQTALNEIEKLEREVRAFKGQGKGKSDSDSNIYLNVSIYGF